MELLLILLNAVVLAIVSYLIVWTVHNTDAFNPVVFWAQESNIFIKRAIGCPICMTYHVALVAASAAAIYYVWPVGVWILTWFLTCFASLWMYSHQVLKHPEEDYHE